MTVTYIDSVATVSGYSTFLKLLFRWKGSVYRLIWVDILIYLALYYTFNFMYKCSLNPLQKKLFETLVEYCATTISGLPLSFVLGFYVSLVMKRWWDRCQNLPCSDNLAIFISTGICGNDEHCRSIRTTLARYICLSYVQVMSVISPKVRKRFPTLQHLVQAELIMPHEKEIMQHLLEQHTICPPFIVPIVWAANIVAKAREEGIIKSDVALSRIQIEILKLKDFYSNLLLYNWISLPLVYTQVITIAVYTYFLASVLGNQLIRQKEYIYFPFMDFLEFFFYIGWVRVAEMFINPFGEDDDDIDVMFLINRNIQKNKDPRSSRKRKRIPAAISKEWFNFKRRNIPQSTVENDIPLASVITEQMPDTKLGESRIDQSRM